MTDTTPTPPTPTIEVAIPVDIEKVLNILNLPKDMKDNPIFSEHQAIVMEMVRTLVVEEAYHEATSELEPNDPIFISFRFAYSLFMLYSTAEFLNLKTIGEGIVKTIGLDSSATELLTGHEIENFKKNIEIRALTAIIDSLNSGGLERLQELKPQRARRIRAGLI